MFAGKALHRMRPPKHHNSQACQNAKFAHSGKPLLFYIVPTDTIILTTRKRVFLQDKPSRSARGSKLCCQQPGGVLTPPVTDKRGGVV